MQLSQHVFASLSSELCVLLLALAMVSIVSGMIFLVLLFIFSCMYCNCYSWSCECPSSELFFPLGYGWEQDMQPYCDLKSLFLIGFLIHSQ